MAITNPNIGNIKKMSSAGLSRVFAFAVAAAGASGVVWGESVID
jgi:hypothetical protein